MTTEASFHGYLLVAMFALAVVTCVLLFVLEAPYGRHRREGWGPTVADRLGWVVMESPAVLVFAGIYIAGARRLDIVALAFLVMWQWHYVNRTFVYPFRLRTSGKRMPVAIVCMALVFNVANAYLNARWISALGSYPTSWLTDPRFIVGALVFFAGWLLNTRSDAALLALRKPGETSYRIPHGGAYRWVSCPNYLGEICQWLGWALCTYSLAGLAFAAFTVANLAPRALSNHRWYRQQFADYPADRKALIPFVW